MAPIQLYVVCHLFVGLGVLAVHDSVTVGLATLAKSRPPAQLGIPCYINLTGSSSYSVKVHLGNRPLTGEEYVPHGSELRFHCPIQRFYRLVGSNSVRCNNGKFDEKIPHCEAVLISNRLVALVDTEYVLGPGGEYVVFAGSQVRMSCYHALSRSYRPSWQWVGKVDHVFIEERVSFGQVTVIVKFEAKNDTNATFTCSDTTDDIHIRIISRPLQCPPIEKSSGLVVSQTSWLRVDFECPSSSILLGPESANCMQFRQWDVSAPICAYHGCHRRKLQADGTQDGGLLFPCQLPELSGDMIAHASSSRVLSYEVLPHGADVMFHCLDLGRVQRIGAGEARCINGNWTSPPPVCAVPERSTLQGVVLDFDFTYRFGPLGVLYVEPRSDVVIKCISPMKLMPTLNYTVLDEHNPVFIIEAEAEDSSAVAKVLSFNTGPKFDAEFICTTNVSNLVFETRSVRIMTREARCGGFEAREGLRYMVEGDLAVFACDPPGRLLGHSILRCQNGDWNHAQPICVFQERCENWQEIEPVSEDKKGSISDKGEGEQTPASKEFMVRTRQVVQENATNYNRQSFGQKPLDTALPPLRQPLAQYKRPLATTSTATDDDDDEDSAEDDEELKKLAEEADKEDNDIEIEDSDEDEVNSGRFLYPVASTTTPSPIPLTCPKDFGLFPHPLDCRHFLYCTAGLPKVMRCPLELIFSPSAQICKNSDDATGCYADE
ncbi:uncharacterized protein LOC111246870 isoform X1 [Varroa destructor]|uniref:Uncharacterized protein n=1 Tax=Varroa destructor TaxID=109461 RepID=A0A7M7JJL0_VARDE|nr:uncharacterized protein LOC111246870 isoform X1 [Varroa destructor]XP_022652937.1 uncharacterized protein LOC111246870 isoform X1 [Varroa destructor]XP_022652938.1 uncharacterized protein LOC111246870 isoform X1 [Varroa destructor]